MERRSLFTSAMASMLGLFGLSRTAHADDGPKRLKVAYHLTDLDKAAFVLGNIANHIDGVGGPDKIDIRLVVHGPALRAFRTADADARVAGNAEKLSKAKVGFEACGNTMKGYSLTLADLLPGFVVAERGGVTRLAELQTQGFVYLRP
jgi:uncharacterized protein